MKLYDTKKESQIRAVILEVQNLENLELIEIIYSFILGLIFLCFFYRKRERVLAEPGRGGD